MDKNYGGIKMDNNYISIDFRDMSSFIVTPEQQPPFNYLFIPVVELEIYN